MALEPAEFLEVRPDRWLRRVPGRETFAWPQEPVPQVVVKRSRGDDWREAWWERLHGRPVRSHGRREYESLAALAAEGIRVPRPLGWAERGAGRKRISLVVMEHLEQRGNLRELIERGEIEPTRAWMNGLLKLVLALHEGGWYHRDLYLDHFLVPGPEPSSGPHGLCLLDVGRVRRQTRPRSRWHAKDLAALAHSTPARVPAPLRLRFLAAYFEGRGIRGRRKKRRWMRAVEARRRRMAAHTPRHGESLGLREHHA
jgi:tRNA A-37 threonylcarbamoyl transferase component Bud32